MRTYFRYICLFGTFLGLFFLAACRDKTKRNSIYMPDMFYSRAYETFNSTLYLTEKSIRFNPTPVEGTIPLNVDLPYHLSATQAGRQAAKQQLHNPYAQLNEKEMQQAKRLYLVHCAICHGDKLDGNGPIYNDGEGPYPARPATLAGGDKDADPDGEYFHTITYGKNLMGAFGERLSVKERWMIITYIRSEQDKINNK